MFGHIIIGTPFVAKTSKVEAPSAKHTASEHSRPDCGVRHCSCSQCAAALSVWLAYPIYLFFF